MSVGPSSTQCRTWCTSVNSVWVQPGNRQPLSRRRISIRWASLGSRRVLPRLRLCPRPVGGDEDLGVAGEPAGDLSGERPEHVELGTALAPGEEAHVGMDDDGGPVAARAAGPAASAVRRQPGPRSASPLQTATSASAMRWSNGVRSRSRRLARAMSELFTTAYWSSGSTPGQAAAPVVEAEEAPGVETRRPARRIGCGRRCASSRTCLADQWVACSASVASVSGLATSTRGLTWSKESFPCERASEIFGSAWSLAAARDPFAGGGGGDAAALDEPRHHGRGAVDPPGLAPVELHDGGEQLALVGGDRPVVLGHAGHQALGPPGHGVGPWSVSEGRGRHAEHERSSRLPRRAPWAPRAPRQHEDTDRACGRALAQR